MIVNQHTWFPDFGVLPTYPCAEGVPVTIYLLAVSAYH
jgi:hypothetical protein